ncbi:putative acetyltransferase [Rubripirellula reticaptiva]|uniref:Putative acetyltransferase n=1 Tax=Rubripirellula reticaptiva TaxID=2528013 RepID=A0A5C6F7D8_9BACT|nr:putative acetyltransferase [Rubripirellula reticaptiva]
MLTLRKVRREWKQWKHALLQSVPGRIGEKARYHFYGFRSDASSRVLANVTIYHPENLVVGKNSAVSTCCQLNAKAGITIGNDVLIGPGSFVWTQNHKFSNLLLPIRSQGYESASVEICDGVWLGARCIVLPGVRLSTGTVVAAGAVVTKSFEPFAILAGVPAKQIGTRSDQVSPSDAQEDAEQ